MRKNYNFYSFFLIPVLTLLLTAGYGLTETNLSVIGNGGGRRGLFLLWGFLSGNYFFLYTEELLEYSGCRGQACFKLSAPVFSLFSMRDRHPLSSGRSPCFPEFMYMRRSAAPRFFL